MPKHTDGTYTHKYSGIVSVPGVGNHLSVVVFLVVIVQYKLFKVQYKSVDFRAVIATAVKVFLLANHHHVFLLLAE